jgi:hypothetical protein
MTKIFIAGGEAALHDGYSGGWSRFNGLDQTTMH